MRMIRNLLSRRRFLPVRVFAPGGAIAEPLEAPTVVHVPQPPVDIENPQEMILGVLIGDS